MYKYGTYKNFDGVEMVVFVSRDSDKTMVQWCGREKWFDTFESALNMVIKTGYIF